MRAEIDTRKNSFTLIRYIAAIQVLIGHCIIHFSLDTTGFVYSIYAYTLALFRGVPIFFGLSGFLIWASLDRDGRWKPYAIKRFKRIYPELWMAVLLSIATIVIFWGKFVNYFKLLLFTVTQSSFMQFWTPDNLRGYGCGTPNGSLWTICVFVQFYIVAWFLHAWLRKHETRKVTFWVVLFAASLLFDVGYPALKGYLPEIIYKLGDETILPYLLLFMVGAAAYEFPKKLLPVITRFWYLFLGQHRTENCVQKMLPSDKIQSWINK